MVNEYVEYILGAIRLYHDSDSTQMSDNNVVMHRLDCGITSVPKPTRPPIFLRIMTIKAQVLTCQPLNSRLLHER